MTSVTQEPGFLVRSPCVRAWFVPLEAVGKDYAEFLASADGMRPEEAMAASERERNFWPTWFAEQCLDWQIIEDLGHLVTQSTRYKTKKALNRYRWNCTGNYAQDYDEIGLKP